MKEPHPGLAWIQNVEECESDFHRFLSLIPQLDTLNTGYRFFKSAEYNQLNTGSSYDLINTKPICCDDNGLFVMRYEKGCNDIALVIIAAVSICSINPNPYYQDIELSTGEIVPFDANMKPGLACILYQIFKTTIELDDLRILAEQRKEAERRDRLEWMKQSLSILDTYGN